MNNVTLVGRFTRDAEVRITDSGSAIARFSLAVDRRFQKDGEVNADFINCIAFGKTAEFVEKYFRKGQRIGVVGRIQTGSYTNKDGAKVYTTDVVVENCEFVESKNSNTPSEDSFVPNSTSNTDGFMNIPDGIEEELPFN